MEIIVLVLLSIALISFGSLALKQNWRSNTNRYFFLFTLFTACWILINFISNEAKDYYVVLWSNKFIFIFSLLLLYYLYKFAFLYPETKREKNGVFETILLLFTILSVALSVSPFIVSEIKIFQDHSEINFAWGIGVYVGYVAIVFALFIKEIATKFKRTSGIERAKLQYLLLGVGLTAIGVFVTNLIFPIFFNIFVLSNIGPSFLIFFVGFTSFSIVKYRLFGIKFIIGQFINFLIGASLPYLSFYLVLAIDENFFGGTYTSTAYIAGTIISIIFAVTYSIIRNRSQEYFLGKFAYKGLNPSELSATYAKKISTELDLETLVQITIDTVKTTYEVENVGVVIFEVKSEKVIFSDIKSFLSTGLLPEELVAVTRYWDHLQKNTVISKEESKNLHDGVEVENVINLMNKHHLELILPLNRKVKLNGIVIVGSSKKHEFYTSEEIQLLDNLLINTSIAVGRSLLFEEVENFNNTLQQKIDEATREITKQKDDLEEALRKERDMLDILGHELRTPLSIARNAVMLLKGGIVDNKMDHEKQVQYINMAEENVKREVQLLETMLSTTKIDKDKLQLNFDKVDLLDVINDSFDGFKEKASKKGIELKFVPPQQAWVYGDRNRMQEISDNLIDNAIKYTNQGSVEIFINEDGQNIKFCVKDTGAGIPSEDLPNLGKKFYRVDTYLKSQGSIGGMEIVRPGGTGLGLYVTFGLIKAMNGTINIQSEVNKGSIFCVMIPKYTNQPINPNVQAMNSLDKFAQLKKEMEEKK
ncbi:MAG: ATP-binding protein [bacterium]